ncbi:MAG TPA: alpha/beta hydrolase [Longimicrobiales bacterium]|nr:alpha/beta hydrolase [Longimicrobiales bacterium]
MTDPRRDGVLCLSASGFHRMAYLEWGDENADRTVVCVHGLTGNARDFDELAGALAAAGYRVVCPDVVGRGASDWLADPEGYALHQYVADMACLVGRLRVDAADWVGTSMGGLIGMSLAGRAKTPVRRMVVNDIGPFVPTAALRRLEAYLGTDPAFEDLEAAERWLREVRAPFGPLSDERWRRMTEGTVRQAEGGGYRLHYDPRIAVPFARTAGRDVDVWDVWDRITCPVLVLRGAESDLLLAKTAEEMASRGPKAEVVELPGCGHAPALMDAAQIACVTDWLRGSPA